MQTNADLVSQAIADMNAQREYSAKLAVTQFINQIMQKQAQLKALQAEIADLKTKLASVTIEPVNAADILGSPVT